MQDYGEIHAIFLLVGQMMKKMRHGQLAEADFLDLHRFCKDVFAKWMCEHQAAVESQKKQIESLGRNVSCLEAQLSLWGKCESRWEADKDDLVKKNGALQAEEYTMQEECSRLKKELAAATGQRDAFRSELSVPSPPPLCLDDGASQIWCVADPFSHLITKSIIELQELLEKQNAYVRALGLEKTLVSKRVCETSLFCCRILKFQRCG